MASLLGDELSGFVCHRNTLNTTYCQRVELSSRAQQCFGRFLGLTAQALAVFASS